MRTILLIGSSRTRATRDAGGSARVYTPRDYPA